MRAALLACLVLLAVAAPAAHALPPGFEDEPLVTGLTQPTSVAFVPDGRILVLEKPGRVKVVQDGAAPEQILDITGQVNQHHDRGALGIAVDGQFATHPYVYVLFTYDVGLTPDTDGRMVGRLVRYELTADNELVEPEILLGSHGAGPCPMPPSDTLDCIPSDADTHSIGTVRAAPDGTLFVGTGDGAYYEGADPNALRTYDERSLSGKVLHVDRQGRGLPGHPYCPAEDDLTRNCTKVFAKGFRNPFRFSLRPDGGLVLGDVGWGTTEELDLIPPGGGRSYGWPCYEGPYQTGLYKEYAECQAIYDAGAQTQPDERWFHDGQDSAAMGGPVYTGANYPGRFSGAAFYGDYARGWIDWRDPDTGESTRFRDDNQGVVELTTDLDGDLVQVGVGDFSDGSGTVTAIRYRDGNRTPVPRIVADRTSGTAPLTVAFDATTSSDPDGDPLTYTWDFGDGTTSSDPTPTHTFAAGTWPVTLTAYDGAGRNATVQTTISSGNSAPTATATAPATFRAGVPVQLQGSGTDPQDGAIPADRLSWRVVLHHGGHTHFLGDFTGANPTFTPRTDHDADSFYVITLTVRDSGNLTGSATVRSDPETVPLVLTSTPPGARLDYGALGVTAPYSAAAAIGFQTQVSAPETFEGRPFAGWSDGGARTHPITIPDTPLKLTATYAPPAVDPTPTPSPTATASPTPTRTPAPTATPDPGDKGDRPTAWVGTKPVLIDRRRRGAVYFTCKFFKSKRCRGVAQLRVKGKRIGRRSFRARVDRSKRLVLRVNRRTYRKLRRRGRLRATLVVDARRAKPVRTRLTLRPIKR